MTVKGRKEMAKYDGNGIVFIGKVLADYDVETIKRSAFGQGL